MIFTDFEAKFTPKTIDDIVFASDQSRQLIDDLVTGLRTFPMREGKCGILLYGVPGTGKSALAKILPDAIERGKGGTDAYERYYRVQAGANGLKVLANIQSQAQLIPAASHHYFVLDEVDELNGDAMGILKSTMNCPKTVFVLTTNHVGKVEAGVKDRCHCIAFNAAAADKWLPVARRILDDTKVAGISDAQLVSIISQCGGSARNILDAIQELVISIYRAHEIA